MPTLLSAGVRVLVLPQSIDPQHPDTLYAGTRTGVFKSLDGGTNWNATNSGLSNLPNGPAGPFTDVNVLAIDPQNPNTVYAIGNFPIYVDGNARCCSRGIFKTMDGGASWNALTLPFGSRPDLPPVLPLW